MEGLLFVLLRHFRPSQNVQELQFHAVRVRMQVRKVRDGVQHIFSRLTGQSVDYMNYNGKSLLFQYLKSLLKYGKRITPINSPRCLIMHCLQAQFDPDFLTVCLFQADEHIQDLIRKTVRSGSERQSHDLGPRQRLGIQFSQSLRITVCIRKRLEIRDIFPVTFRNPG